MAFASGSDLASDYAPFSARVRVKVCGITRAEDALILDSKVDWLGFNFWPGSKRYIAPEAAAPIIASLRHAIPVGIFVDASAAEIARIAALTGIRIAQLHGSEGWDTIAALDIPVIKAIPQDRIADWGGLKDDWNRHPGKRPQWFLVDSKTDKGFGGTGTVFDWTKLRDANLPVPFFLAGGIGPHNVADAVRATRPYAVDLNGKVETAPGVKDVGLVRRCLDLLAM
jgi:phosphoribosylanthranilate isomerase